MNFISRKNEPRDEIKTKSYKNNTYCAEVRYFNPNTQTKSIYNLIVVVEENEIVKILWPNKGSINEDHFLSTPLNNQGFCTLKTDKGYEYEVQITGQSAGCIENSPIAKQCLGIIKNGRRCKHMTDNKNGFCWQHQNQNKN